MKTNYIQDVLNNNNFFGRQSDLELCSLVKEDDYFTTRNISLHRGDWFDEDKQCVKPKQTAYRVD